FSGNFGGIYRMDASDGHIIESLTGSFHEHDRIWKINNNFIMAWQGQHMSVYSTNPLALVDRIDTNILTGGGKSVASLVL
ncbi:hypothetical protein KAR91_28665, partial [Candidatus Pacearchaeota archaeon]|nr:hypothetical protein [Candidatus Pacearchaeota archaeon]